MMPSDSAGELSHRRTSASAKSLATRVARKTQSLQRAGNVGIQTTQDSSTEDVFDWVWKIPVGVCKAGFVVFKYGLIACDKAVSKAAEVISDELDDIIDRTFSEKPKLE